MVLVVKENDGQVALCDRAMCGVGIQLDLQGTRRFFDAFFDLSPFHWQGFLSSRLYLNEVKHSTLTMTTLVCVCMLAG